MSNPPTPNKADEANNEPQSSKVAPIFPPSVSTISKNNNVPFNVIPTTVGPNANSVEAVIAGVNTSLPPPSNLANFPVNTDFANPISTKKHKGVKLPPLNVLPPNSMSNTGSTNFPFSPTISSPLAGGMRVPASAAIVSPNSAMRGSFGSFSASIKSPSIRKQRRPRNASNGSTPTAPSTPTSARIYSTKSSRSKMASVFSERLHDFPLSAGATSPSLNWKLKGPPKTSRFYKSLPENRTDVNSSAHHYNPFLYLQHRTRVNPPLDIALLDTREKIPENYLYKDLQETEVLINDEINMKEIKESGNFEPRELPVFYMSKEEFKDPIAFSEKITHIGNKYGAIKIVPPNDWSTSFSLNTELFWFRSRRQLLNNFKSELDSRIEFYFDLFEFHYNQKLKSSRRNGPSLLNRLPSIDKRSLDLYRLRKYVVLKGGYDQVCKKKLWAQVGRELGYSGRIMTSLSSSLKSAYQRVLLSYDMYKALNETNVSQTTNENGKRDMEENKTDLATKKLKIENTDISAESVNQTQAEKTEVDSQKASDTESFNSVTDTVRLDDLPIVLGSAIEYRRPRDLLRAKGFRTNFDNTTENRRSITTKDKLTLNEYNFFDWFNQSILDILDDYSYESKISPFYNLKQFFEKSLKFQELTYTDYKEFLNINPEDYNFEVPFVNRKKGEERNGSKKSNLAPSIESPKLEKLYWEVLSNKERNYEIEIGMNVSSSIHESAFPTFNSPYPTPNNDIISKTVDPWNLNNFPINDKGLLRYLDDDDYTDLTRTKLMVGMLFSTENWNMADHFLYECSYNHLGSTKVWYTIPPAYQQKYEALVKSATKLKKERYFDDFDIVQEKVQSRKGYGVVVGQTQAHEFIDCSIENKISTFLDNDRFVHQKHLFFDKFFNKNKASFTKLDRDPKLANKLKSRIKDLPISYNQDVLFPPEYLLKHGIPVYKTYQQPGQFIIKFPKCYSANISLGFNVCEKVNYSTVSWIEQSFEAEKWLIKQNIIPGLSSLKILINIAKSKDMEIKSKIKPLFDSFLELEFFLREKFKEYCPNLTIESIKKNEIDYKDTISDHNLSSCYPSKVLFVVKGEIHYQISLHNFIHVYETNKKLNKLISKKTEDLEIKLQVYYTDEQLKEISSDFLVDGDVENWLKEFDKFIRENSKPKFKTLKKFAVNINVSKFSEIEKCQNLLKFIDNAEKFTRNCKILLKSSKQNQVNFSFMKNILTCLESIQFTSPEIEQTIKLRDKIQDYYKKVNEFLQKDENSDKDFNTLIAEGEEFGISEFEPLALLKKIKNRKKWLSDCALLKNCKILEVIQGLYNDGLNYGSSHDQKIVDELHNIYLDGISMEGRIKKILSSTNIKIDALKSLINSKPNVVLYTKTEKLVSSLLNTNENLESDLDSITKKVETYEPSIRRDIEIEQKLKVAYENKLKMFKLERSEDKSIETVIEDISKIEMLPQDDMKFLKLFSIKFAGTKSDVRLKEDDVKELFTSGKLMKIESVNFFKIKNYYTITEKYNDRLYFILLQFYSGSTIVEVLTSMREHNGFLFELIDKYIQSNLSESNDDDDDEHGDEDNANVQPNNENVRPNKFGLNNKTTKCKKCSGKYNVKCLQKYEANPGKNTADDSFKCLMCDQSFGGSQQYPFEKLLNLYYEGRRLLICPSYFSMLTDNMLACLNHLKVVYKELKMTRFLNVDDCILNSEREETKLELESESVIADMIKESDIDKLKFYLKVFGGCLVSFEFESKLIKEKIDSLEKSANKEEES